MISTKRLEQAFPGHGKEIRDLLAGNKDPADYPAVQRWVAQCFHAPSTREQVAEALNEILGGFGVEGCRLTNGKACEYINRGDTYTTTLLFDYRTRTWKLTCWGDWVETNERRKR